MATSPFLEESSARTLVAGDLQAVLLPDHGMLVASLRYKGVEILGAWKISKRPRQGGAAREYRFSTRGRTGLLSHGIAFWGERSCSTYHRHFSISTSIGFRCTVYHGRCFAG